MSLRSPAAAQADSAELPLYARVIDGAMEIVDIVDEFTEMISSC